MRLSRDSQLAIGLFVVLALLTVFAAARQTQQQRLPPLASDSNAPDGARALRLWLEALGYQPYNEAHESFALPEGAGTLLILEPIVTITPGDWRRIDEWVENGGALVLAGKGYALNLAARHYDFTPIYADATAGHLTAQVPLFSSPPLTTPASIHADVYFETGRSDFVVHLAVSQGPTLVSWEKGKGRIFLSGTAYPFSNAGLKEPGNPALALNLIFDSRRRGTVWFDEWHHGLQFARAQMAGPTDWLVAAPAGRALLFVAAAIFFALLFRGRRFGRPAPLKKDVVRRAPLEYITAIANLNRRAGHRAATLRQYHHFLKRALGQRYRLAPDLPDSQFVAQLAAYNPRLDEKTLRNLLARLSRRNIGENEMIQLAMEAADWTKE